MNRRRHSSSGFARAHAPGLLIPASQPFSTPCKIKRLIPVPVDSVEFPPFAGSIDRNFPRRL